MTLEYELPGNYETLEQLREWVWQQFQKTELEFNLGREAFYIKESFAEPLKPRDGMIVRADGTEWNPDVLVNPDGDPGYWGYEDGEWILISRTGTPNSPTIPNGFVTNAQLANMAQRTIKARKTLSTGAPEDCTLTEVLDFVGSAAQGDILYRGASDWSRLAKGSTGDILTQGASIPAWGSLAAWQKISAVTANNSATVDFTGMTTAFAAFAITFTNVVPATDGTTFNIRTDEDNGASFDAGATDYQYAFGSFQHDDNASFVGDESNPEIICTGTVGNASEENFHGIVYAFFHGSRANFVTWDIGLLNPSNQIRNSKGAGCRSGISTRCNAIRFMMSSGNLTSGVFTLYGIPA